MFIITQKCNYNKKNWDFIRYLQTSLDADSQNTVFNINIIINMQGLKDIKIKILNNNID